jgi:hypothetical protein
MSKRSLPTATAREVRAWFGEHKDKLPEAAAKSVAGRGRLHPEAVAAFNAESGMAYAERNVPVMPLAYTVQDKAGRNIKRTATVPVFGVRLLAGELAGKRGRFSAKALAAAGEAYADSL